MKSSICIFVIALYIRELAGHGMMLDPINRSSLWKVNPLAAKNHNDNQNFCGGAYVQNELNGGKCGVCGDAYTDPHPQDNENTGIYGSGIIVATYLSGSVIDVHVLLTANHLGWFNYTLCKLDDPNAPEPGEECFQPLLLEDGSAEYTVSAEDEHVFNRVQLPEIKCERCVLRWNYRAGNNWGVCEDGIWRMGCGPQEHFRSCSDIVIV